MSSIKKFITQIFINILEIILFIFIITILYHFDLISEKIYSFLKLIILLISIFINSFSLGKKAINKGYDEGIKYGFILIIISLLLTLIWNQFKIRIILYYGIVLLTSTLGSMIGISRKKISKK